MSSKSSRQVNRNKRDPLLGSFYSNRSNPSSTIKVLKSERSYGEAKQILQVIRPLNLHHALFGVQTTNNWDVVMRRPAAPLSRNWIQEVGWLAHGFRYEAGRINEFLGKRRLFGKAYLLGDFETANEVINTIEESNGVSLWLAERRFMLLQAKVGFAAHKEYLSKIQSAALTDSLVSYFVTTFSNRIEGPVALLL